jgi:hypothetical protein
VRSSRVGRVGKSRGVHKWIRKESVGLEYVKFNYTTIDLGRGPGGGGCW